MVWVGQFLFTLLTGVHFIRKKNTIWTMYVNQSPNTGVSSICPPHLVISTPPGSRRSRWSRWSRRRSWCSTSGTMASIATAASEKRWTPVWKGNTVETPKEPWRISIGKNGYILPGTCECPLFFTWWKFGCIHSYLEPVNVLYFWASTLQNKVFSNQHRGHLGSRYLLIYQPNSTEEAFFLKGKFLSHTIHRTNCTFTYMNAWVLWFMVFM